MARPIEKERKMYLERLGFTVIQAHKISTIQLSRLCRMDESARKLVLTMNPKPRQPGRSDKVDRMMKLASRNV